MKKLNRLLVSILVVGLALTAAHVITAQQRGGARGQRQPQRGQFDPARMMQRRMDNIEQDLQEMNVPDNELAILKTQIEALLTIRMDQGTQMRQAVGELQKAMDAKDNAQIKARLDAVKAKWKEQKAKAEKIEEDLLEILPLKVEAYLTVQGIVNGDGRGGMGFGRGFGGPRDQRRQGAPGGQPMQRRPGR